MPYRLSPRAILPRQNAFKSTLVCLCSCTLRAKSALGRWLRKDGTRAWSCLFSLCFHKWQNYSFVSFLQVPRLVKVILESSPYFKLIGPTDVCRKVAPGMPSTFRILFTPEENKVRLESPRIWCLQWKVNMQGWIQSRASGAGFEELSWFRWGCAGSRTGGNFPHSEDDALIGWRLLLVSDFFFILQCWNI